MKACSILALALLHHGPGNAQLLEFEGACSISALSDDRFGDMAVDQSGNVYVIGTVGSQILLGKRTPDCQWLWTEQWGTNGNDHGLSIELDDWGHLYVSGTLGSGAVTYQGAQVSSGSDGFFVARLDTSSTWDWIAGTTGVWGVGNNGIVLDGEGGVYVAGEHSPAYSPMTFGGLVVPTNGNDDVFLAKLNDAGVWQWAKDLYCAPWAGAFPAMHFRDLEIGTSGDILLGGRYTGYHAVFDNDTIVTNQYYPCGWGMTFYLAAYRTDGTFDWARTAEADMAGLSDLRSIFPLEDGGILALIQYGDTLHLGTSVMIHPWAACLAHFAADGTVISADPLQDHEPSEIIDAIRLANGMIYAVAYLSNTPLAIAGNTYTSVGGTDLVLSALDGLNGVAGLHLGGSGNEAHGKLRATSDGLLLGGSFEQTFNVGNDVLTSSGASDMFTTRISTGPLGVDHHDAGGAHLVLAPDPTTGSASLTVPPALQEERIELLDRSGRLLRTFGPGRSQVDLDLSELAPGTYLLRCGPAVVPFVKE